VGSIGSDKIARPEASQAALLLTGGPALRPFTRIFEIASLERGGVCGWRGDPLQADLSAAARHRFAPRAWMDLLRGRLLGPSTPASNSTWRHTVLMGWLQIDPMAPLAPQVSPSALVTPAGARVRGTFESQLAGNKDAAHAPNLMY
jgi:hypothetical protein